VEDISETPFSGEIYGRRDAKGSTATNRVSDEKLMLFAATFVKSIPTILV